jgi:hypothetical protein
MYLYSFFFFFFFFFYFMAIFYLTNTDYRLIWITSPKILRISEGLLYC